MRLFYITGLMAATMLTPAIASAAEIAPTLNNVTTGGKLAVSTDLNGTAALQRDRRSERRTNRQGNRANRTGNRSERREARSENRNNRGQARVERAAPTRSDNGNARRANRQQARQQMRRSEDMTRGSRNDRNIAAVRGQARRVANNNTNRTYRQGRQDQRRIDSRTDRRQDRVQNNRAYRDGRQDQRRIERRADRRDDRSYRNNRNYRDNRYNYSRSDARREIRRDSRRWNRSWRNNNRYNWRAYRNANRSYYNVGRYYSPYRNHSYRRWNIGVFLGSSFYGSRYWINDPWRYRLPAAYSGSRWVRYYDDVLLVDTYTGEVIDVIYDFFY